MDTFACSNIPHNRSCSRIWWNCTTGCRKSSTSPWPCAWCTSKSCAGGANSAETPLGRGEMLLKYFLKINYMREDECSRMHACYIVRLFLFCPYLPLVGLLYALSVTTALGGCVSRAVGSTGYREWGFTAATTETTCLGYGKAKTANTRFIPPPLPATIAAAARAPRRCRQQ